MDFHDNDRPTKRFKHQSYKDTLKEVHLPSALIQSKFEQDIPDTDSHFHEALQHWRELNLSPAFVAYANDVNGLSASMPLLLYHWHTVVELWLAALEKADDEALKALLDLFQKLAHDLRTTLAPKYPEVLMRLVHLLPRSLSAPALTALLATFSALFKYVLIPAVDSELLAQAWSVFRGVLPQCNPEVQRATADIWGTMLRRLKAPARRECVVLIANSVDGPLADACAWMFVSACKSASQTLHTTTASILASLLRNHLHSTSPDASFTLVRRVLTALIHHCKGAEQFAFVADVVVAQFVDCTQSIADDANRLRITGMLEITTVMCAVRQGSRLTAQHLTTMLSHFVEIPFTDEFQPSLLKFLAAALTAGDMGLWMGLGRKALEYAWQCPVFGVELCGALASLDWGGWKLMALPHVLKHTPDLLESHPEKTLQLLVALHKEKRFSGVDIVWRQQLQAWVDEQITEWRHSEENALILHDILALSSLLKSITGPLIEVVNRTLDARETHLRFDESFANSAWVLGACLQSLSICPAAERAARVDLIAWTNKIAERWSWSSNVLFGLISLIRASEPTAYRVPFDSLYTSLQNSLLSYSQGQRLGALSLLGSPLISSSDSNLEIVKRCLQAEEVPLDAQNSRERTLKITRLPVVVKDGDEVSAEICCRWLIAQLKVNLRPLWSAAAGALSILSERFGDLVWHLMFEQLRNASGDTVDVRSPPWMNDSDDNEDDTWEEERSWRDPSAHKLRSVTRKWHDGKITKRAIIKVEFVILISDVHFIHILQQSQTPDQRFDCSMYEAQLLFAMGDCSSLVEKHNRDIIPFFLSVAGPGSPSKLPRHKLSAWLTLFSKFVNPKALHSTEQLRSLYITLLSHPDRSLQRLALSCLLTYKSPRLSPHEDRLRSLMDDTKWRDDLTQLNMNDIEQADRPELVGVIIRILFGMMSDRRGRTRGTDRRAAILPSLAGCTDEELHLLVDLMLQPLTTMEKSKDEVSFVIQFVPNDVSERQQIGFLTLLGDVLKHLGSRLTTQWPSLLEALLNILGTAQARITSSKSTCDKEEDEETDEAAGDTDDVLGSSRNIRVMRQLGLKRFADFFRCPISYDFTPYLPEAFRAFISPRLPNLDAENTQAPSAILELFYTWSLRADHAEFLVNYDNRTLPKVYDCLIALNVKSTVVVKIFDIVDRILTLSAEDERLGNALLKPHVSLLLKNMSVLIDRTKGTSSFSDTLGRRQIAILSQLSPYLEDSDQARMLLELFLPLLRKPTKIVPEKVKTDITNILCDLFSLIPDLASSDSPIFMRTYAALAHMFQNLRSRQARLSLVAAFRSLSSVDTSLSSLAELMESLNAYSTKRIDEPDFDQRLAAFATLNETLHSSLSCQQWLPIIYNMLNFIQDPAELTVRSNASLALKRFVDRVCIGGVDYESIFLRVLYPGLKNGLHSKNEMVRAELLSVVSYAALKCDSIDSVREMRGLLAEGDEEANFFNNIHHIQVHRRTRAIRRLIEYCDGGHLRNSTLAEVFIPLVGNFLVNNASIDHLLANEAISATGHIARHLNWGSYYALAERCLRQSSKKDASERIHVRTLVAILDNFHFPMDGVVDEVEEAENPDANDAENEENVGEAADLEPRPSKAALETIRIVDAVSRRLLPRLLQHLEQREETEDSLRIPIAIGIVQVAKHLPQDQREPQITRLLTVLSQVFRSKSQETRDLARDTLCRIAVILGPSYLPMTLRELRAALLRGPQLHVLAFVTHALLIHVTSGEHATLFNVLDDCVNDIAHIAAEVIFGESGKDVQSENFKTKMREVRSSASKGYDSFTITAKHITPPKISNLLVPVRNILKETESLKVLQQVDDLLRRIASGLNANEYLVPKELLVLCHTLISQNARFLREVPQPHKKGRKGRDDAVVQMRRKIYAENDHYANNSFRYEFSGIIVTISYLAFRFVNFGLDLFVTAHRRSRFDFQDQQIIARLEPMVTIIGNTLYSDRMEVVILGLKAAAAITKCPLKFIDKSLPVLITQMIDIIRQAGTTESDAVQVAFKSLATILREQSSAQVKEKDLVYLLELLSPDLEDPSRQASVFTMLRAIVSRKFVVPEIYDLMDRVSQIMVTSQSPQVQELCRGVLLQFLLDYPQGKGRLRTQMTLLAKNLSYVYESGRKSVMELLSAIIAKFAVDLVREYADLLFVALVMVVANDESAKCREMASELIKSLFARLTDGQRSVMMSHVHTWAQQTSQPQLARVSMQVYGLIVDFLQQDITPYMLSILEDLNSALSRSAQMLEFAETELDGADTTDEELNWQMSYHALFVFSKVLRVRPDLTKQPNAVNWPTVVQHLVFPHSWTRAASCRLLGLYFSAVPVAVPQTDLPHSDPLSRQGMADVAKKLCIQLRSPNLDAALSLQIVKNLFYIGKSFCMIELPARVSADDDDNDVEGVNEHHENERNDSENDEEATRHPLPWLFSKLSYQARHAHTARRNKSSCPDNWVHQPASVLKWFAAMVSHMEASQTMQFLVHILSPVYRIAEDDTIRDPQITELKSLAVELQDLVQAKVGTTQFANVYNRIRQGVLSVRRERRNARMVQATTNPELAAKKKLQRNVMKKESRKRKNRSFADNKGRAKRFREG
ncbi:uncharacterized protein FIBRA_08288 [Fibroporia radiculosa]|uniref:Uncharacterized protein n=1 Tax=Fibroporia radiculosa TaxID=599839 RepID=J4I2H3_9APHY|nr:uncharacterized protein FIBRA_08288 [Fibroporia radiculosa]CCM06042.1 predicted protein [Fibroporia radiculosa]